MVVAVMEERRSFAWGCGAFQGRHVMLDCGAVKGAIAKKLRRRRWGLRLKV